MELIFLMIILNQNVLICKKNVLKLTFLGTGTSQGVPIIGSNHPVCLSKNFKDKRLRTACMFSWEDNINYVIDVGPDFRQQMLRANVNKLDGILITHEHTDHVIGLDDIRPFFYREKKDMSLYAEKNVFDALAKRFHYIFDSENKYPGAPDVDINAIDDINPFVIGGKTVQPIRLIHGKLPILGFRIEDVAYCTDVKTVPEESLKYFKQLDVLVINALREEEHFSHFTLKEALAFIDLVQPQKAYLTHISHLLGFHDEVEAKLPENVHLAYDGLILDL